MVPEGSKEEIADKDITCYKVLRVRNWRFLYFEAQYRNFKYWFWYKYFPCKKVKLEQKTTPWGFREIHKGYHSWQRSNIVTDAELWENNLILVELIIPKGTKYFKNEYEYVSERIKLKYSIKGDELKNKIKEQQKMKEEFVIKLSKQKKTEYILNLFMKNSNIGLSIESPQKN